MTDTTTSFGTQDCDSDLEVLEEMVAPDANDRAAAVGFIAGIALVAIVCC